MIASLPFSNCTITLAVSKASGPSKSAIAWSMLHAPVARMRTGSQPMRKRAMSRSWTAMSLKMPPPPLTYSGGGGAGSREHSLTTIGSPISAVAIACLMREKLGSKRRWSAVMSLTPLRRA